MAISQRYRKQYDVLLQRLNENEDYYRNLSVKYRRQQKQQRVVYVVVGFASIITMLVLSRLNIELDINEQNSWQKWEVWFPPSVFIAGYGSLVFDIWQNLRTKIFISDFVGNEITKIINGLQFYKGDIHDYSPELQNRLNDEELRAEIQDVQSGFDEIIQIAVTNAGIPKRSNEDLK